MPRSRTRTRRRELLGVKTWLSTLDYIVTLETLCLSDETLKAVGPFYLVYAMGSKISHTRIQPYSYRRGKLCVTCRGLHIDIRPVLAQRWAVWSVHNLELTSVEQRSQFVINVY